jgi:hypothetical protein
MSMRVLMAIAVGLVFVGNAPAANFPPAEDATALILDKLYDMEVEVDGNINDMSLMELVTQLTKRYALTFSINQDSFKAAGIPNVAENKPSVASTNFRGLTLHQFLNLVLDTMGAT